MASKEKLKENKLKRGGETKSRSQRNRKRNYIK